MTREEAIKILKQRECCRECVANCTCNECDKAFEMAIEALKQEPCEDIMAIHTQGLDEGIRCAMCTNSMKSDRGCDGGCMFDKDMYEKVMDVIRNQIVPSTIPTRKKGKWVKVKNGRGGHECNICQMYAPSYQSGDEYLSRFCPNCGAKMQEVEHE